MDNDRISGNLNTEIGTGYNGAEVDSDRQSSEHDAGLITQASKSVDSNLNLEDLALLDQAFVPT